MIVITGAAGFIGSCLAAYLNSQGFTDLVLVDDFSRTNKRKNYQGKAHTHMVARNALPNWLRANEQRVQAIVHLGARTDTMETDERIFQELNLNYSQTVWKLCAAYQIPLIYASSAATYGDGSEGFSDDAATTARLKPLNAYARSKHAFDCWALEQADAPYFWAGLKFFNVYGPNEYHKGRMASVVWHAYQQIQETGRLQLFRSYREDYADGEQRRDFIYVGDIVRIIFELLSQRKHSGLYNAGTGQARSFLDLGRAVFTAMGREPVIEFIEMPEGLRQSYQYFTEAPMDKLRQSGVAFEATSLENGIQHYVQEYLMPQLHW
jgi:ADP-L-glycero-D-manno-heptose 6-epimerase